MLLTLNPQEDAICRYMAQTRQDINRQMGVQNKRAATQDDFEIAMVGFGAEMAVAKHFNVYPDFGVSFEHADYDLVTRKGLRVDVKCAMKENTMVYVEGEKKAADDLFYFFVLNRYPSFQVLGWQWSNQIILPEFYRSENVRRPCYAYPKEGLRE